MAPEFEANLRWEEANTMFYPIQTAVFPYYEQFALPVPQLPYKYNIVPSFCPSSNLQLVQTNIIHLCQPTARFKRISLSTQKKLYHLNYLLLTHLFTYLPVKQKFKDHTIVVILLRYWPVGVNNALATYLYEWVLEKNPWRTSHI